MGRGTYVTIVNKSKYKVAVEVVDIDSMTIDVNALQGIIPPESQLPVQYIETSGGLIGECYFTFIFKNAETQKPISKIRFFAKMTEAYRLHEMEASSYEVIVDTLLGEKSINIDIISPLTIGDFPYNELCFNRNGELVDKRGLDALRYRIREEKITDIFFFAHGFNNSPDAARGIYHAYFNQFKKSTGKIPGICGIIWPSQDTDAGSSSKILNTLAETVRMTAFYDKLELAGNIGQYLGITLNGLISVCPGVRIHLGGHSMGGHLIASALRTLQGGPSVKSVFLIQAATSALSFTTGDLAQVLPRISGPIIATYSGNDEMLKHAWTAAQAAKLMVNIQAFSDIPALGCTGPIPCDTKFVMGDASASYRFASSRINGLSCPNLKDHDDYKNPAFVRAHQIAAGLL